MYRDFYHLEYAPFTATPEADLASLSPRHRAVLERVVTGLNKQQSLIAFMGEAGLGKIALLHDALATYGERKYKMILIDVHKIHFQNQIYFKEIIKAIYQEIGYEIKYQSSPDALADLHDIFIEECKKGSHLVIVIDHVNLLSHEVLKNIPQLIEAYPYEQPVAQLVLAGEPVLEKHLRDSKLQQLKKRVQLIATLSTFNRKESITYIQRKLSAASSPGNSRVFSNAAIRHIAKAAKGIPRNLDMLCTDALVAGYMRRTKPIPARMVKQVLADFQGYDVQRTSRLLWVGVAVVLLLTLVAGARFWDGFSGHLQTVAQWPQQAVEQMRPLFADLAQKTPRWSRQTPELAVSPRPSEKPAAVPAERPSFDVVTPPPLPRATPTVSSPKAIVETPKALETPLPPRHSIISQVATLIDQHFPRGGAFGLKVWSDKAPDEAYVEGEKLVLYVKSDIQAFLRIDYYQADGKVVHLLPNPLIDSQVQAGQRFTLGGSGNAFQFKVAAPFGTEMLVVIASPKPIEIETATATGELNDAYVDRLSRQLRMYEAQGKAAATYIRMQTQPQRHVHSEATDEQPVSSSEQQK